MDQVLGVEVSAAEQGLELQLEITTGAFAKLKERRRNLTGRTGCGLCGAESLAQALPPVARVSSDIRVNSAVFSRALAAMSAAQTLKQSTGSVHGAALCDAEGNLLLLREDVGRHNALDKLIGAMARSHTNSSVFALVSSRASFEMVTKAASANIPLLAAVSAPTSLAIDCALESGLTLVTHVCSDRQAVYAGTERVVGLQR